MKNDNREHGGQNESQRSSWRIAAREIIKWMKAIVSLAGMAAVVFFVYWAFTRPATEIDQTQVEWFMWIGGGVALLAALFGWEPKQREKESSDPADKPGTMHVLFFRKSPKTPEKK